VVFAFIHEILAVMFMPVFGFVMLCHLLKHWPSQTPLQRSSMFLQAGLVLLFAFVLSGVVSTLGTRDDATIAKLQAALVAKVDFGLRPDAFAALSRSSAENLSSLMPGYWKHNPQARIAPKSWLAALPSVLFLLRYGACLISSVPARNWWRWLLGLSLATTVMAPQTLNFVGWDWNRWNAISLLGCFCCIIAVRLYFPSNSPAKASSTSMLTAAVIACSLSLAADTPLFDMFEVQFFPFDEQIKFIRKMLNPAFHYRPGI
jgi:hypothetical protein